MKYRVVQGSYGRYEDGILKTYRARTENDVVELDADAAVRLGAQVELLPEAVPTVATPVLPTAAKAKRKPDEAEPAL